MGWKWQPLPAGVRLAILFWTVDFRGVASGRFFGGVGMKTTASLLQGVVAMALRSCARRWRFVPVAGLALVVSLCAADQTTRGAEVVLRGHGGAVFAALLTPDGTRAVTGGADGTARLWDAATGQELRQFTGHTGPVTALAISADGRTLVTASQDNSCLVWEVPRERPLAIWPAHRAGGVVAATADGRGLLTGGLDPAARLWDAARLVLPADPSAPVNQPASGVALSDHALEVRAVAWRPDGGQYVTIDDGGRIVLRTPFLDAPLGEWGVHGGGVAAASFLPGDALRLLTAGRDGTLRFWDGPPVAGRTMPVPAGIRDLLLLPGGSLAVASRDDGPLQVIDVATLQPVRDLPAVAPARSLAAVGDGSTVVVGDDGGRIRWVNVADGSERGVAGGHEGPVLDVVVTADGGTAFSAGADGTLRQWARPPARVALDGHSLAVKAAVASSDGQWFATAGDDQTVRVWNGAGQPLRTVGNSPQPLTALAVSADSRQLVVGDALGGMAFWNPQDGAALGAVVAHRGAVRAIALDREARAAWSAGADGTIKRWRLPVAGLRQFAGQTQSARSIAVSLDGRLAFSGGADSVVRQWEIASGQLTRTFGEGSPAGGITAVAAGRDGAMVAAVTETGSVRAWAVADGRLLLDATVPSVAQRSVVLIPLAGRLPRLAAIGDDQQLRLWDIPPEPSGNPPPLAILPLPEAGTDRLALSADGAWLVSCGAGRIARRWQVVADGLTLAEGGITAAAARVTGIALSADGRWFAAAGEDGRTGIWDARQVVTATGDLPPARVLVQQAAVRGVAFQGGPSSRWVVTAADDGVLVAWDPATGLEMERAQFAGPLAALALTSETVLASGSDPLVRAWTPAVEAVFPAGEGAPGAVGPAAFALAVPADGQGIVAGVSGAVALKRWDRDGNPLPPPVTADEALSSLATTNDGRRVIVATASGKVWKWHTDQAQAGEPVAVGAGVTALASCADHAATQVLIADGQARLRAIDLDTGRTVEEVALPAPATVLLSTGADGTAPAGVSALGRHWVAFGAAPQGSLQPRAWVRTVLAAPSPLQALVLSPDLSRLFAAGDAGTITAIRAADGQPERTFGGNTAPIRELAIVPSSGMIVAACADGVARGWDSGGDAPRLVLPHRSPLTGIALSADGQRLVTAAEDGLMTQWLVATGVPLQTFPGHQPGSTRARFLPDGLSVLSGSADRSVRLVKSAVSQSLRLSESGLVAMAMLGGGEAVVAGEDGGAWRIPLSATTAPQPFATGPRGAAAVACRGDGQSIALGTSDGRMRLFGAADGQIKGMFELGGAVTALAWSKGRLVAGTAKTSAVGPAGVGLGGAAGRIVVLDAPPPGLTPPGSPAPQPGTLVVHQSIDVDAAVDSLALDDERRIAWSVHSDGTLRAWACAGLGAVRRLDTGAAVLAVAISHDGGTLAAGGVDQSVRLWETATGQQRAQLTGHTAPVLSLAFTPDDAMLVSASGDRTLRLWDTAGGRALKQLAATDEAVYSVAVDPAGRIVGAGGGDRLIHLVDLLTGSVQRTLAGHTDFVHGVAFNRQGTRLLSYGYAGQFKIWNPADGALLQEGVAGRIGNSAAWGAEVAGANGQFGKTDDRIIVACGDATARIIEVSAPAR